MKWYTETENVDRETGEILSKSRVEREGWVKKKTTYTTKQEKNGVRIKKNTNEYERNRQQRIQFQ